MDSPRWLSAHIYFHDPLDDLIDGAARPLVAELRSRGLIDQHFFVRYWQGGPHLRLRLLPGPGADHAAVAGARDQATAAFLRSRPSHNRLGPDDYQTMARSLASAEIREAPEPVEPLAPNNTLQRRAYDPEYDRYGGRAAMAAAERHFTDSSDLAFEVIAAGRGRDHRTGQALAMMLVAALVCDGPEGLLGFFDAGRREWGRGLMFGDVDRQEAQLEERYRRQRSRLHDLARQLTQLVTSGAGEDGAIHRWISSVRRLKAALGALEAAAELAPRQLGRVIRLCTHMHCNRLGISLPEEAYLRFLLWRAAGDLADREPPAREPIHDERQP